MITVEVTFVTPKAMPVEAGAEFWADAIGFHSPGNATYEVTYDYCTRESSPDTTLLDPIINAVTKALDTAEKTGVRRDHISVVKVVAVARTRTRT